MFNFSYIPEAASTFATEVDKLFYALTAFSLLFCLGITIVFIFLGIRYRQKLGSGRKSVHVESIVIELVWTIIPVCIALGIFWWGAVLFMDYNRIPENTLDLNVMGKQWMWKIQHPNGKREINQLHVPVGQPVKLTMHSQDVIHSFYVPAFRVKQDVLPGRYSTLWFEATKVGEYGLFCAEYCGTEHSTMGGSVVVMEPADYEEWLGGGAALTPVEAGGALFQQMGCATCHAAGEQSRGPQLEGIYGTDAAIKDGGTVAVDEEYLRESIMDPTAKIVEGFTPLMPSFKNQLSDDDVANLVAYIKSLSE